VTDIDPDAIYLCTETFFCTNEHHAHARHGGSRTPAAVVDREYRGDDPVVAAHPQMFRLSPSDVLRRQQAQILEHIRASGTPQAETSDPEATSTPIQGGPIATREQAEAALQTHGSERKAARAIGVSKTHLRRLLGKET
jgi:hypothetical protein